MRADIARALRMDSKAWTANLTALPAAEREQVQRIIDAAVDGALETQAEGEPPSGTMKQVEERNRSDSYRESRR